MAASAWRRVRARPMLEAPRRDVGLVMCYRMLEKPSRATAIPAHVEHLPLGILPVIGTPGFHAAVVDQRQPPHVLATEADVIHDLDVVGVRVVIEEQARKLVSMGMRR